ncbi:MAG: ribosomal protein S18-alanine N-acetyltransferase [Chloroflexi bacterium]|nr:ribosomal protein S18-alanine N-acetyltransferase [Chloroflexota bacterium]
MRTVDIEEVMAIERLSFPNPWPASAYRYELEHNPRAHYYVARSQPAPQSSLGWGGNTRGVGTASPLVGYGGFWYVAEEAHISTIAVHPEHRGRGLGELLLASMIEKAISLEAAEVTLEVRVSNQVAQELYRKYAFHQVGRRRGYYTDNHEDALLMSLGEVRRSSYRQRFEERLEKLSYRLRARSEAHRAR